MKLGSDVQLWWIHHWNQVHSSKPTLNSFSFCLLTNSYYFHPFNINVTHSNFWVINLNCGLTSSQAAQRGLRDSAWCLPQCILPSRKKYIRSTSCSLQTVQTKHAGCQQALWPALEAEIAISPPQIALPHCRMDWEAKQRFSIQGNAEDGWIQAWMRTKLGFSRSFKAKKQDCLKFAEASS